MPFTFPPPEQLTHTSHFDDPSEYPYPGVPVDKGACRLLGPTALIVQALMGVLVIASLVLKRQREKPMRPWRIWLFDVSKQILGQGFVHGLNLLISDIVAHLAQGNPCDLYFLNVLIDTTLGVGFIYLILHGADMLFTNRLHLKGFQSGKYGDPPSLAYWGRQAAVYVLTILTMKLLVVGLFAAWPGIFAVGEWLLSWTAGDDRVQVIFVMGIFPIIMNVLQFWLIDSIVKASASLAPNDAAEGANDSARQPLIRDPESDGDDDDDQTIRTRRRHDIESPPTPAAKVPNGDNASEHKSTACTSSSTHVVASSSIKLHSYPPESSFSSSSSSSASADSVILVTPTSASSSSSLRSKKSKRRSPPPPIRRPPPHLSNGTSYIISVTPSPPSHRSSHRSISSYSPPQSQARQRHRSTQSHGAGATRAKVPMEPEAQAWDNWADGEDWAEKVGEEDWTGRRMGATKAGLDVWGSNGVVEVS